GAERFLQCGLFLAQRVCNIRPLSCSISSKPRDSTTPLDVTGICYSGVLTTCLPLVTDLPAGRNLIDSFNTLRVGGSSSKHLIKASDDNSRVGDPAPLLHGENRCRLSLNELRELFFAQYRGARASCAIIVLISCGGVVE